MYRLKVGDQSNGDYNFIQEKKDTSIFTLMEFFVKENRTVPSENLCGKYTLSES